MTRSHGGGLVRYLADRRAVVTSGDAHVHTETCEDASASIAEQVAAAEEVGLSWLCLTTHVRADSDPARVERFVADVAAASGDSELALFASVEVKVLDAAGSLDLPPGLDLSILDTMHLADHRFPGVTAASPQELRRQLDNGELSRAQVSESFALAFAAATLAHPGSVLAHPGSILVKAGLADVLTDRDLTVLAAAVVESLALVEDNLKWRPAPDGLLPTLAEAGARIVCASDAHDPGDLTTRWAAARGRDDDSADQRNGTP